MLLYVFIYSSSSFDESVFAQVTFINLLSGTGTNESNSQLCIVYKYIYESVSRLWWRERWQTEWM